MQSHPYFRGLTLMSDLPPMLALFAKSVKAYVFDELVFHLHLHGAMGVNNRRASCATRCMLLETLRRFRRLINSILNPRLLYVLRIANDRLPLPWKLPYKRLSNREKGESGSLPRCSNYFHNERATGQIIVLYELLCSQTFRMCWRSPLRFEGSPR